MTITNTIARIEFRYLLQPFIATVHHYLIANRASPLF
jgi:hypothetical protein